MINGIPGSQQSLSEHLRGMIRIIIRSFNEVVTEELVTGTMTKRGSFAKSRAWIKRSGKAEFEKELADVEASPSTMQ